MFNIKTGVNYIGDNTLPVAGELVAHPGFSHFDKVIIEKDEMYAANCIRMNEFQKIDRGLTCLSLRFKSLHF